MEKIEERVLEDEMKSSYLDYAMSVIVGRALPDVRDGLKPVHRRILYAMYREGMLSNRAFKKCARIVGDVLGKFHPHGDKAVYDALVRMAQDFSMRYPLIEGQGNFGSVDGDEPAAMRYTEARLDKKAEEMLKDIDKETVEFMPNFDSTLSEPKVLPSKIPNLLVNGSTGIAVGMITSIPPHNLRDVANAILAVVENPEVSPSEIVNIIKGPDFPTGGVVIKTKELLDAYHTGRGKILIRGSTEIEEKRIIIREIPYMVNKAELIKQIAELAKKGVIEGITNIIDESDRSGIRVRIDVNINPRVVLNQIYRHTNLEKTMSFIFLALVDGVPKLLNIKEAIEKFIEHREKVVVKRCEFERRKAKERLHIVSALLRAIERIDETIELIKASADLSDARERLMKFLNIDETQAKAILEMKLQRLAKFEKETLVKEKGELEENIRRLEEILGDRRKVMDIIKKEVVELKEKYGDERRTRIVEASDDVDISKEDLIKREAIAIMHTKNNYIKSVPLAKFKVQKRGGRGIAVARMKEGDFIKDIVFASTHDELLLFTKDGRVFWLKGYDVPRGGRYASGTFIRRVNKFIKSDIVKIIPVDFEKDSYVFFLTKGGFVKKCNLNLFKNKRKNGIIAIKLRNDEIADVMVARGDDDTFIATSKGQVIRFRSDCVRAMGREAFGVVGIKPREGDEAVSIFSGSGKYVLTITENGYGKRSEKGLYRLTGRGGRGIINLKVSEKTGKVIGSALVNEDEEVMIFTKDGMGERIRVKNIPAFGRASRGVRLIRVKNGDKVTSFILIRNHKGDK